MNLNQKKIIMKSIIFVGLLIIYYFKNIKKAKLLLYLCI